VYRIPGNKTVTTLPGRPVVIHISIHGEQGERADCQNGCFA